MISRLSLILCNQDKCVINEKKNIDELSYTKCRIDQHIYEKFIFEKSAKSTQKWKTLFITKYYWIFGNSYGNGKKQTLIFASHHSEKINWIET